ncbi:hypothetical protein FRC09_003040 [Ceratobasidium sp. 395]|nr:hypothetical protein FRC09_003040 [Ceratobasidium sp. 395]
MGTAQHVESSRSSFLEVMCISELSEHIFGQLDNSDLARLASLSRVLFDSVVLVVWEEVNVKPLIMLIPGVKIDDDDASSAYGHILSVPMSPDLSRLRVYAPHVKHLRGTPEFTIEFSTEDNSPLELGLLPNLQHITLVSQRHYDHDDLGTIFVPIDLEWVRHFLCPGLASFRMFGVDVNEPAGDESNRYLPWMDRTACLRLVTEMSDRCPRVETLQMFPDDSGEGFCEEYYCNLASMSNLRSFTWSGHRVDQELMSALGALPDLKSLCFMSNISETPSYYSDLDDSENGYDPDADTASNSVVLSEQSFPALQSLELCELGPQTIAKVCGLSPLFQGLTRLAVSYGDYSSPYWRNTRVWSNDVFACLGHDSPHLADLEISSMPGSLVLTEVTDRLRQMPLRRLNLDCVWISDEVGCRQFAEALPNIDELRVRSGLSYLWLRIFASKLPSLRHLCIGRLDFAGMGQIQEVISWEGHSGLYHQAVTIQTNFRLRYPMERQVDEVARYIYETWPNVRCETYGTASDSVDQKAARLLNARLEEFRSGQN